MSGGSGIPSQPGCPDHVLISSKVRSHLEVSPADLERLFFEETIRLRRLYLRVGDPGQVYRRGAGLHHFASETTGVALGAAVYEAFIAEMLLAQGSDRDALTTAIRHLATAERHASAAPVPQERHRARVLAKVTFLRAIIEKSLGSTQEAQRTLRTATEEPWWSQHADPADVISITRQRVMMSQSLTAHVELAEHASRYRTDRPIEYFRTLKRTFELLVNSQFVDTADRVRPHLLRAYHEVSTQLPAISGISLAKNIAQMHALAGDPHLALSELARIRSRTVDLGLHGQMRQVDELARKIRNDELKDALETFRVAS